MEQTMSQFKEHMKVYNAFENSPLGHLVKEGRMFILLTSNPDELLVSNHIMSRSHSPMDTSTYGDLNILIDSILEEVGVNFSLVEITNGLIEINKHRYGYLFYSKEKCGTRLLLFGTIYSKEEIRDLREQFYKPIVRFSETGSTNIPS